MDAAQTPPPHRGGPSLLATAAPAPTPTDLLQHKASPLSSTAVSVATPTTKEGCSVSLQKGRRRQLRFEDQPAPANVSARDVGPASPKPNKAEDTNEATKQKKPKTARSNKKLSSKTEKKRTRSTSPPRGLTERQLSAWLKQQDKKRKCLDNVYKRNRRGETYLHRAAIEDDLEFVHELLEHNAPINAKDNAGWTPLHEACNHGHLRIAHVLLLAGANVDALGMDDITPLHDAAINEHYNVILLLLKHGANPLRKNKDGETAIDVCEDDEVKELLLTASRSEPLPDVDIADLLDEEDDEGDDDDDDDDDDEGDDDDDGENVDENEEANDADDVDDDDEAGENMEQPVTSSSTSNSHARRSSSLEAKVKPSQPQQPSKKQRRSSAAKDGEKRASVDGGKKSQSAKQAKRSSSNPSKKQTTGGFSSLLLEASSSTSSSSTPATPRTSLTGEAQRKGRSGSASAKKKTSRGHPGNARSRSRSRSGGDEDMAMVALDETAVEGDDEASSSQGSERALSASTLASRKRPSATNRGKKNGKRKKGRGSASKKRKPSIMNLDEDADDADDDGDSSSNKVIGRMVDDCGIHLSIHDGAVRMKQSTTLNVTRTAKDGRGCAVAAPVYGWTKATEAVCGPPADAMEKESASVPTSHGDPSHTETPASSLEATPVSSVPTSPTPSTAQHHLRDMQWSIQVQGQEKQQVPLANDDEDGAFSEPVHISRALEGVTTIPCRREVEEAEKREQRAKALKEGRAGAKISAFLSWFRDATTGVKPPASSTCSRAEMEENVDKKAQALALACDEGSSTAKPRLDDSVDKAGLSVIAHAQHGQPCCHDSMPALYCGKTLTVRVPTQRANFVKEVFPTQVACCRNQAKHSNALTRHHASTEAEATAAAKVSATRAQRDAAEASSVTPGHGHSDMPQTYYRTAVLRRVALIGPPRAVPLPESAYRAPSDLCNSSSGDIIPPQSLERRQGVELARKKQADAPENSCTALRECEDQKVPATALNDSGVSVDVDDSAFPAMSPITPTSSEARFGFNKVTGDAKLGSSPAEPAVSPPHASSGQGEDPPARVPRRQGKRAAAPALVDQQPDTALSRIAQNLQGRVQEDVLPAKKPKSSLRTSLLKSFQATSGDLVEQQSLQPSKELMALMPRVGEAFLTFNPEASLEQQIASTFEDVEHVMLALPRADRLAYKAMAEERNRLRRQVGAHVDALRRVLERDLMNSFAKAVAINSKQSPVAVVDPIRRKFVTSFPGEMTHIHLAGYLLFLLRSAYSQLHKTVVHYSKVAEALKTRQALLAPQRLQDFVAAVEIPKINTTFADIVIEEVIYVSSAPLA